jgi:hypothetical protein
MKWVHCNKTPIYVFPEKELRGLSPNIRIHVSESGQQIFLQQNRHTVRIWPMRNITYPTD